jgi:mannose-1-phosphate guanylyltransferase/mannose-6-phosphate isomerase
VVIQPVVLSGGSGTRLWPLSREFYPKQLLPLVGELSLLQETINRLDGLLVSNETKASEHAAINPPIVVCNEEHRFLVAEQIRQINKKPKDIVLEPFGRNTAPALTLAALSVLENDEEVILLVMPADHVIKNKHAFHDAVLKGTLLAQEDYLVTFGVVPHKPETGYGYIKRGGVIDNPVDIGFVLDSFVEKPDLMTAQEYLQSGKFLWNSGMFMMKASKWMEAIEKFQPNIARGCQQAFKGGKRDLDFYRIDSSEFEKCPSDSIDYAVMEKVTTSGEKTAVIPLDADWSDVGAWSALWDVSQRDSSGNVLHGDVFVYDSHNNLLSADSRFLATVGIEDMVVVETSDAVLVARKDRAQDVKHIVNWLKEKNRQERQVHRRVYRPWGSYEGVVAGDRFQVKRIIVNPGAALSLQMHHHRAEHWIIVCGTAQITRGEEVFMLSENQSTYIPLGVTHRLENPGTIPLEIIEVQSGSYLGEDDIVRFEDNYGRKQ